MQERIQQLRDQVEALTAQTAQEVEDLRIKYISKKGLISQLFDEFKTVPNEEKRLVGQQLNVLKEATIAKINALREALSSTKGEAEAIDWTRTAYPIRLGTRHPLTLVQQAITSIFARLSLRGLRWRMMTMYSLCSTLQRIILLVICRIPSSCVILLTLSSAPTPRRYRLVQCSALNRLFASSAQGVYIATRLSPIVPTASSIR